jgi:hypothetical protein
MGSAAARSDRHRASLCVYRCESIRTSCADAWKKRTLILIGFASVIQRKGDRAGLEAAILSAVKTPIDRYIREYELRLRSRTQLTCTLDGNPTAPRMTIEAMRDRMRIFLDVNWHWQASNLVEDMPEVSERRCLQYRMRLTALVHPDSLSMCCNPFFKVWAGLYHSGLP